jgi:hypothetical protein
MIADQFSKDNTPASPEPRAEACKYCGVIAVPTLSKGTPPHAIKASCPACGRFIKWISTLAPAERLARKMKYKLAALQSLKPSQAQLSFLEALGEQRVPESMAEASQRIEELREGKPRR